MNIDEIRLLAYVDGELAADDAAQVEAEIARDPALAAEVARQRALRAQIARAFDDVLDEPVPAALRAVLARPGAEPADIVAHAASASASVASAPASSPAAIAAAPTSTSAATTSPHGARPQRRPRAWLAMAACLLAGVVVARWLPWPGAGDALIDGDLRARGALAQALDDGLGANRDAAAPVTVVLSFRAAGGRYCRAFTTRAATPLAGLACRDGDGWRVATLATLDAAHGGDGALRQAATPLPAAVLAEIDARIDGDPLDAAAERSARAAHWR